jgi:hypothetical protein
MSSGREIAQRIRGLTNVFDKEFFNNLEGRLKNYFSRFPSTKRVAVIITTNQAEYLLVEVIDCDDKFITFIHWPREKSDLPARWNQADDPLAAMVVPYEDVRCVEFDPKIVRGSEIGFTRPAK